MEWKRHYLIGTCYLINYACGSLSYGISPCMDSNSNKQGYMNVICYFHFLLVNSMETISIKGLLVNKSSLENYVSICTMHIHNVNIIMS